MVPAKLPGIFLRWCAAEQHPRFEFQKVCQHLELLAVGLGGAILP